MLKSVTNARSLITSLTRIKPAIFTLLHYFVIHSEGDYSGSLYDYHLYSLTLWVTVAHTIKSVHPTKRNDTIYDG